MWPTTRTVATRAAVSRLRKKPQAHVDDEVLAALPTPDDGPEEQHFRAKYKVELKAAFEEAMASLTPQQRNVLRHHYVDSLSIDEIGALYGVHRTTAFRWPETARATLAKRTQAGFAKRVRASPSEMQSIVRLLQSNIELSLQRVLSADES
jgi:RNA polymerase sigma-70 factor (ECF subfamily)